MLLLLAAGPILQGCGWPRSGPAAATGPWWSSAPTAPLSAPAPPALPPCRRPSTAGTGASPALPALAGRLDRGESPGEPLDPAALAAPLPRAYEWLDGSAFLSHVRLARRSRGAELPARAADRPAGLPGRLGRAAGPPRSPALRRPRAGPRLRGRDRRHPGRRPARRRPPRRPPTHVRLVCLLNDVTLRNLVPARAGQGLRLRAVQAGDRLRPVRGHPGRAGRRLARGPPAPAGALPPATAQLVGRLRRRRDALLLRPPDRPRGPHPRADRRHHPRLGHGVERGRRARRLLSGRAAHARDAGIGRRPDAPTCKPGDTIRIEVLDGAGRSVFGAIEQTVVHEAEGSGAHDHRPASRWASARSRRWSITSTTWRGCATSCWASWTSPRSASPAPS